MEDESFQNQARLGVKVSVLQDEMEHMQDEHSSAMSRIHAAHQQKMSDYKLKLANCRLQLGCDCAALPDTATSIVVAADCAPPPDTATTTVVTADCVALPDTATSTVVTANYAAPPDTATSTVVAANCAAPPNTATSTVVTADCVAI